jgi:hypothetical protein
MTPVLHNNYAQICHSFAIDPVLSHQLTASLLVVKSRRIRWAGHVAHIGEDRGVHRVLVGKPERKRPLGRPRRRWEGNIKMDLQEVRRRGVVETRWSWLRIGTGGGHL